MPEPISWLTAHISNAEPCAAITIDRVLDLVIIGGGNMGQALVHGFLSAKVVDANSIGIVEASEKVRHDLGHEFPNCHVLQKPVAASSTILAIKPGDVELVASSLSPDAKQRVLSIAAGVPTMALEVWLGGKTPVIRAMPNTPAMLGVGMTALCAGRFATDSDLDWAKELMSAVGKVAVVKESQFDAVTGVSGSGPAYIFLLAEAMIDAAVNQGLPLDLATQLVVQTIFGSGAMLMAGSQSATELRQNVTSPGGTTAAGLASLESDAVRAAVSRAISAATARSQEMTSNLFKH